MNDYGSSAWTVEHLRGTERLARQDAADMARLNRIHQETRSQYGTAPRACIDCKSEIHPNCTTGLCVRCQTRARRAKESETTKAQRLERKRAAEKVRRDALQAAGDRREAERLRRWRAEQTVARAVERSVAAARRRLEERGIVVKVTP